MSKICNRDYSTGNMLSVKMIEGLAHCPSCEQPTECHGKSVEQRALFWALCYKTGISSQVIAIHMIGYSEMHAKAVSPPSDAYDRGRCIRLLELIPEWITRLPEMVKYDQTKSEGIVINSSGISTTSNSWAKQIPLIMQEGKL